MVGNNYNDKFIKIGRCGEADIKNYLNKITSTHSTFDDPLASTTDFTENQFQFSLQVRLIPKIVALWAAPWNFFPNRT